MWTHYKRNIILIIAVVIILVVAVVRSHVIQPIRPNTEELAIWRAQQEAFVVFFPYSMIYDSTVSETARIGEDIFVNNEIYKIQLSQKKYPDEATLEFTVGVNKLDKGTYVLPGDYNPMISKEKINIGFPSQALAISEVYANLTFDLVPVKAINKNLNRRIVLHNSSDIPQNDRYPVPEILNETITEPSVETAAGGTQFKIQLYTWETSSRDVYQWNMTVLFNGRISAVRYTTAPDIGIYGL